MLRIATLADANDVLAGFVPSAGMLADNYTLERMRCLMAALGDPQERSKVVHVAGTSGKTSTAYFMASLLREAGMKVGLTVSPHVDGVNERVQIDLTPLDETTFCRELSIFLELVQATDLHPTYFEVMVALAYWEFARQRVDYVIVEVGLGGLLDGTNVISRADKVCLLTDIGFDHTDILGPRLTDVAAQKAGIIQPDNVVMTHSQTREVMRVFREVSAVQSAELYEVSWPGRLPVTSGLPTYQQRNWYLAYQCYGYISRRDGLPELSSKALARSQAITIPARTQIIEYRGKYIVFDGAHNAQKMQTMAEAVREMFDGKDVAVLVGMLKDKENHVDAVMNALKGISTAVVVTGFSGKQDVPRESLNPNRIAEACRRARITDVTVYERLAEAVQALLARPEPVLVITGSFYLMHAARELVDGVR